MSDFSWQPESFGWVQPEAGAGTVSLVEASDATIEVVNGAGPTASLSTVYGPPHAFASTSPGVSHTTSTGPGAAPTYPTSFTYLSLGSVGSPILFPAGTYKVEFAIACQGSANNTELWFDAFVNGVSGQIAIHPDFVPINYPVGKAGATVPSTAMFASFVVPVATGFWFDIHVAHVGGGSVKYITAYIATWRMS